MRLSFLRSGLALLTAALWAAPAAAQSAPEPGTCQLGNAQLNLNVNNVSARIFNTGTLFFGGSTTNGDGYIVPTGSGKSSVFASGIWVGGLVDGELRVAGATYGAFNFWTGPLDPATGRPVNPASCTAYDRIYSVSRAEVLAYEGGAAADADLAEWPASLGAPVIDGDGTPGNYNPAGGDRPDIVGDQGVWWVMNDVGGPHTANQTPVLGIEVRVLAFAFERDDALDDATFYRYTVVNRSGSDIEQTYVSVFVDPDLGDPGDDYIGSDPASGLGYVYNSDDEDGDGTGITYGGNPPAVGYDFFQGPIVPDGPDAGTGADTLGTSSFMYFSDDFGSTDTPDNGIARYRFMRGLWGDGTQMRAFGDGYAETQGAVTTFAFSGNPVTNQAWSERNPGVGLPSNIPDDRRFLLSTGPFTLADGAAQDVVFGIVYARGTSNLSSITALRAADALAQETFEAGFVVAGEDAPGRRPRSARPRTRSRRSRG